ncbi:MAG: hypothetical protein IPK07_29180 [Deltaproteobacteria bacterium]|nr:hypothetical protein [Deltaproteobacteria bacterium]
MMRGFVLSLAALMGVVMLTSVLMWWANVWLARSHVPPAAAPSSSSEPIAEQTGSARQV